MTPTAARTTCRTSRCSPQPAPPAASEIQIDNPETGNTATATGSAAEGSTITTGSLTVIFPPGTKIDTSADSKILIKFVPGEFPRMEIKAADLVGQRKTVEMLLG